MEAFKNTVTHLSKLLASSIICSVVFLILSNHTNSIAKPVAQFLILGASLLIFQGLHIFFCHSFTAYCDTASEYFVPTLCSYGIYLFCAVVLYAFRLSETYNYLFLPTRFLEPITDSETLSMTVAHIISLAVIFITYLFHIRKRRESGGYRSYGDY